MKYDADSALNEISRRKDVLIYNKKRRKITELAVATAVCAVLLVLSFANMNDMVGIEGIYSVYGSFLLSDSVGGYVLVGVLCFAAAVIITLLCVRRCGRKDSPVSGEERERALSFAPCPYGQITLPATFILYLGQGYMSSAACTLVLCLHFTPVKF